MKVAIIDLGSNAARMLIAEIDGKKITVTERLRENVRLSENMYENMMLQEQPVKRTLEALAEFKAHIDKHKVDKIVAVATAAMRNAKNKEVIVNPLKQMGICLEIIDGTREAYYDYIGVINSNKVDNCVIIDIGGASTEIILVKNKINTDMISIPFGAVSITEQCITDYDASDCTKKAEEFVSGKLDSLKFLNKAYGLDIVVLGGTGRALGQVDTKSDEVLNGYSITAKRCLEIIDTVNSMTLQEIKDNVAVEKKRADIVKGGFVIVECMLKKLNSNNIIISRSGVREGILYELAD